MLRWWGNNYYVDNFMISVGNTHLRLVNEVIDHGHSLPLQLVVL